MEHDLITISMAAYNHEKFIEETILSCIRQTYKNLELIIIDDGSKDNTYDIMKKLKPMCEKRFVRTLFLTQENMGRTATCDKLRKLANGKYIYCISSDDTIADADAITFLHDFLSKNPDYGVAVGNQDYINENSDPIPESELPSGPDKACRRDSKYLTELLKTYYGYRLDGRHDPSKVEYVKYSDFWFTMPVSNGYLLSKKYLDMTMPLSVNCCNIEDFYMFYQISKFCKIKVFDKILFHYRLHGENYSNSDWLRNYYESRGLRFYELYLLDTKYTNFFDKDCLKAPNYIDYLREWRIVNTSPLWDEDYYISKNPSIINEGWIPIIHYLSTGILVNKSPCKLLECIKIPPGINIIFEIHKSLKHKIGILAYILLINVRNENNIASKLAVVRKIFAIIFGKKNKNKFKKEIKDTLFSKLEKNLIEKGIVDI